MKKKKLRGKDWNADRSTLIARKENLRSRAAYKLEDLQKKTELIKRGDRVLDLGAAPGGFSLTACKYVKKEGLVVGVDVQTIAPITGVKLIQSDIFTDQCMTQIRTLLPKGCDVVLSDLSPSLTGIKLKDHAQASRLHSRVFDYCAAFLNPSGNAAIKVFMGEDSETILLKARQNFASVRMVRCQTTRTASQEFYVVAKNYAR